MGNTIRGILLVAHGSDIEGAERDLLQVAAFLRLASGCEIVEVGFLKGTSPSISEAVAACVEQGVTDLLAMPYFLSADYLQRQAMRLVEETVSDRLHVKLQIGAPLGLHPRMSDLMLERMQEALSSQPASR